MKGTTSYLCHVLESRVTHGTTLGVCVLEGLNHAMYRQCLIVQILDALLAHVVAVQHVEDEGKQSAAAGQR